MKLSDIIEKPCSGEWGTDDESGKGIPVLRTTNFTNEGIINYSNVCTRTIDKTKAAKKFLRQGDIIIEKSGGSDKQPVGRVVYFEGENDKYLYNNFTAALRVKDRNKWECKYVFYALFCSHLCGKTRMYQNKTTGLHNLQLTDYINDVIIPDNPLAIQREIAYNLDKVSEAIEQCRKILEKLDYLVKAKFAEMFGDCVSNPKNWHARTLEDIADVGSSKRVFVEELKDSGVPFYRGTEVGALAEGKKITPELFITKEHYDELCEATGAPKRGDLLMPSICPDGRIWVVDNDNPFYFKDGRVLWVHNIAKDYNPIFLLQTLKNRIMSDYNSIASGTTFAELKIFALKKCKVFDVPLPLQEQFAEYVQKTDRAKAAVKKTLEKAQVLKAALMQKYFG